MTLPNKPEVGSGNVPATGLGAMGFPGPTLGLWHVLHTKSRQEKVVAKDLAALGIGSFLPVQQQLRYYGKRKFVIDEPMFPGYVFLRGSRDQAYAIDRTKRIVSIIDVVDQVRLDWELRNLALALSSGTHLDPYPYLTEGTRVEVKSGPLRGLQGFVQGRSAKLNRLILKVDILGQAVAVEIDGSLLEPLRE